MSSKPTGFKNLVFYRLSTYLILAVGVLYPLVTLVLIPTIFGPLPQIVFLEVLLAIISLLSFAIVSVSLCNLSPLPSRSVTIRRILLTLFSILHLTCGFLLRQNYALAGTEIGFIIMLLGNVSRGICLLMLANMIHLTSLRKKIAAQVRRDQALATPSH